MHWFIPLLHWLSEVFISLGTMHFHFALDLIFLLHVHQNQLTILSSHCRGGLLSGIQPLNNCTGPSVFCEPCEVFDLICRFVFCINNYCLRGSLKVFQTFFVWALLLIVHTQNSSPLHSNLLWPFFPHWSTGSPDCFRYEDH